MLSEDYLEKGITALSRSGARGARATQRQMAVKDSMTGHTGAAIVAAYFLSRDSRLETRAQAPLKRVVDSSIELDSQNWYTESERKEERIPLCTPYPREPDNPDLIQDILSALDHKIGRLQASGHCTIFASLALKGLQHRPDMVTPSIVSGIRQLIGLFNGHPGQGYYGKEKGWLKGVPVEPDKHLPAYRNVEGLVDATLKEVSDNTTFARKGYGNLLHLVEHASALVELAGMGYGDLAHKGFAAHRTHIMLLRSLPPSLNEGGERIRIRPKKYSPFTYDYWNNTDPENGIPDEHSLSVIYSFFHIVDRVTDPEAKDRHMPLVDYVGPTVKTGKPNAKS